MTKHTKELAAFLDASPSVYHAVENLRLMLEKEGYTRLFPEEAWTLEPGGKYYMTRGGSAVVSFRIPETKARGFMMAAAHADRPCFQVKEDPELSAAGAYVRLGVERYGGMLMASWLDRPLSVAGRVMVRTGAGVQSRLVNIDRDLLLIPSVAIHMNRKANEGLAFNPAVDLLPLMGSSRQKGAFRKLLAEAAGAAPEDILGSDLYLYARQKACVWGAGEEYISAQGLDDLQCAFSAMTAFLSAEPGGSVPLCCVFDSEEVGSCTIQGADSDLLRMVVGRICECLGQDPAAMLERSLLCSADNAHAVHPNHPEFSDPGHGPVPGGGVVLKYNSNRRYTTDGRSAALFRCACREAGVPVQVYYNRADLPGGSTLGNISASQVSVPSVDVGLAQLAMHACYETAGAGDGEALTAALRKVFSMSLRGQGEELAVSFGR